MSRHQKKSGSTKKREKRRHAPGSPSDSTASQGTMGSIVGGFKRAIGTDTGRKRTFTDAVWTVLLLIALGALLFWQFGR
jgi:hypothetical protein